MSGPSSNVILTRRSSFFGMLSQCLGERIALLDCYRFLAAVAVLFFHLTYNGTGIGKLEADIGFARCDSWTFHGSFGVQFFFLISGFSIFLMKKAQGLNLCATED